MVHVKGPEHVELFIFQSDLHRTASLRVQNLARQRIEHQLYRRARWCGKRQIEGEELHEPASACGGRGRSHRLRLLRYRQIRTDGLIKRVHKLQESGLFLDTGLIQERNRHARIGAGHNLSAGLQERCSGFSSKGERPGSIRYSVEWHIRREGVVQELQIVQHHGDVEVFIRLEIIEIQSSGHGSATTESIVHLKVVEHQPAFATYADRSAGRVIGKQEVRHHPSTIDVECRIEIEGIEIASHPSAARQASLNGLKEVFVEQVDDPEIRFFDIEIELVRGVATTSQVGGIEIPIDRDIISGTYATDRQSGVESAEIRVVAADEVDIPEKTVVQGQCINVDESVDGGVGGQRFA